MRVDYNIGHFSQRIDLRFGRIFERLVVRRQFGDRTGSVLVSPTQFFNWGRQMHVNDAAPVCAAQRVDLLLYANRIHHHGSRLRFACKATHERIRYPLPFRLLVESLASLLQRCAFGWNTWAHRSDELMSLNQQESETGNQLPD